MDKNFLARAGWGRCSRALSLLVADSYGQNLVNANHFIWLPFFI
jgi:hypothetical protein